MTIRTNLKGRLRNTNLALNQSLMPVFEAVVNSIHAIEERGLAMEDGKIVLNIEREYPNLVDDTHVLPDITGFKIEDNGCGFNNVNYQSFSELDSEHKADKGCRGVGRLLWLKVFNKIKINSSYLEDGIIQDRNFEFNSSGIFNEENNINETKELKTLVHLQGINKNYLKTIPKQVDTIANHLLEHCLWYFVRDGSAPRIIVTDGNEEVSLENLLDKYMLDSSKVENFQIRDYSFEVTHIKFRASVNKNHSIAFCAANRLVKEEKLKNKIAGLYEKIEDSNGKFIYTCYVTSSYLDKRVRSERTGFDIEEVIQGDIFENDEIGFSDIREAVLDKIRNYLHDVLKVSCIKSKERVQNFIDNKAPRYKPIEKYAREDKITIDPDITDMELEQILHGEWFNIEQELIKEGQILLNPDEVEDYSTYKDRLEEYLSKVSDLKKSDLANYVTHRRLILDLLEKSLEIQNDNKYPKEEIIHKLILPMRIESTDITLDKANLWLIDEKLSFHNYLASDKPLSSMPITDSTSTKEPDILALQIFDNPLLVTDSTEKLQNAAITIVELKRPMRNDFSINHEEKDPIQQVFGYLQRIKKGNTTTKQGRPINFSSNSPSFCYILADLTDKMRDCCINADLHETSDRSGYFGFHKAHNAYIEVISFDRLLETAKERNRAFFDKLGLPITNN